MSSRQVTRVYDDPLDMVWRHCANQLGVEIVRDDEVFASWDGQGKLRLGLDSLDADDCLAQLVLHELCHALVEGDQAKRLPDWGLNSPSPKGREHEFAALRLQASLADRVGLRSFFSATTDFCEYYQFIPSAALFQPLSPKASFQLLRPVTEEEDRQALVMAQNAFEEWEKSNWKQPILDALESTRQIYEIVSGKAQSNSVWHSRQD